MALRRPLPAAPMTPRGALRWPQIRRAIKECRPSSVLEIGCGKGSMGARIAALTDRYVGLEPDATSFAQALRVIEPRGGSAHNMTSDDLPVGDLFDLVCAFEVLEHFDDDVAALRSWTTRARPGGHVLLSVPAWQHLYGPWDEAVGHYRRYSPDDVDALLCSVGLEPATTELYGWPLAFVLESVRNRLADGSEVKKESMAEQTARSGRLLQPASRASAIAVSVGIVPFQQLQRLRPNKGNGLVALARKPA